MKENKGKMEKNQHTKIIHFAEYKGRQKSFGQNVRMNEKKFSSFIFKMYF